MRMWKVPPNIMCRKHLLGEHVELHMFVGTLRHGMDLKNSRYVSDGLVEIHNIKNRHDELVAEMQHRGYKHKTPIEHGDYNECTAGSIIVKDNIEELRRRCPDCRRRMEDFVYEFTS